eukprot:403807_1
MALRICGQSKRRNMINNGAAGKLAHNVYGNSNNDRRTKISSGNITNIHNGDGQLNNSRYGKSLSGGIKNKNDTLGTNNNNSHGYFQFITIYFQLIATYFQLIINDDRNKYKSRQCKNIYVVTGGDKYHRQNKDEIKSNKLVLNGCNDNINSRNEDENINKIASSTNSTTVCIIDVCVSDKNDVYVSNNNINRNSISSAPSSIHPPGNNIDDIDDDAIMIDINDRKEKVKNKNLFSVKLNGQLQLIHQHKDILLREIKDKLKVTRHEAYERAGDAAGKVLNEVELNYERMIKKNKNDRKMNRNQVMEIQEHYMRRI